MIELLLPVGPSNNLMYRIGKGKLYKSSKYKTWLADSFYLIHAEHKIELFSGPVSVRIDAYPADNRLRDLDGYLKATFDGLEYWGIIENDRQIVTLSAYRHTAGAYAEHRIGIRVCPNGARLNAQPAP